MYACPCGSQQSFSVCCERFINAEQIPKTPEQLMRSRYSAFATQNEAYLRKTWYPSTRPDDLSLPTDQEQRWLRLVVHESQQQTNQGRVRFTAYSVQGKKAFILSEDSLFLREDGLWLYHSGTCQVEEYPISRNQACLCGSKLKFKRCCLA